jgi:inorganic phosphate transporter, PiT family
MSLVLAVILVALVFEYINGFHDTANSIATVVSTRVLTPREAIVLAAVTNLIGALVGTAVAQTIASGLVDARVVSSYTIICALLGAVIWDLVTWYVGLPTSSSHALIGGLCGAALASAHNNWASILWPLPSQGHWWTGKGLLYKVFIPMFTSPICGFILGFLLMALLYVLLRNWRPATVNRVFGKLQLLSAGYMGFSHGSNDAQKTMGIVALTLLAGTKAGTFDDLPGWLGFLRAMEAPPGHGQEIKRSPTG